MVNDNNMPQDKTPTSAKNAPVAADERVSISVNTINDVLAVLTNLPYAQVAQLIATIQGDVQTIPRPLKKMKATNSND